MQRFGVISLDVQSELVPEESQNILLTEIGLSHKPRWIISVSIDCLRVYKCVNGMC